MRKGGIIELSASVTIFIFIVFVIATATNAETGRGDLSLTVQIGRGVDEAQTVIQQYSYIDPSSSNSYPIIDLDKASSYLTPKQTENNIISIKSTTGANVVLPILTHSRGRLVVSFIKVGEKK
jgi:hypothetical protein